MTELQGKVILVTGGASGIGEAVVTAAVQAGALVAVVDLDLAAAEKVAARHEGARAYQVDVADPEAMKDLCAKIVADFGKLDGAVNNAGIVGQPSPLADGSIDNWHKVIAVNLTGVWGGLKAQIPHMLANGGGSIVNMASMAGVLGEEGMAPYVASKHGVVGLTKVAALEYGKAGIRCNAVCPSYIRTPLALGGIPPEQWAVIDAMHPIGRTVTPQEVANTTIFLLSDKSGGMTGSTHLLDGGIGAK
jgi:NAD(P)-dependent dehydrogenase (short-subunit alcohol dehydrogenase family)